MKKNIRKIKYIRSILLAILLLLFYRFLLTASKGKITNILEQMQQNPKAGLVYLIITIGASILFIPITWVKAMGGAFLGFKLGFFYSIIGVTIGSSISFFIARNLSKDMTNKVYNRLSHSNSNIDIEVISQKIEKSGFKYVFYLRSFPGIPFAVVNYLSGFLSIGFKDYFLASILGMLPTTFISIYLYSRAIDIKGNPKGVILPVIITFTYYMAVFIWRCRNRNKY